VSHSADGGLTWSSAVPVTTSGNWAPDVRFADARHGWVSGSGLFATDDGGQSWKDTGTTGTVGPVETVESRAWALQNACDVPGQCKPRLLQSVVPDGAWLPAPHQPQLPPGAYQLVRPKANTAFIAADDETQVPSLVRTLDGGTTWQALQNPCGPIFAAALASLDGATVWMVCGGEPSAGNQDKRVFVSRDGGATWSLKSSVPIGGYSATELPSSGYVSGLALTSATTGFLALSRSTLATSRDQGATWREPGGDAWDGAGGEFRSIWFVDRLHGWAAAGDGLHRTVDGGATWTLMGRWPGSELP